MDIIKSNPKAHMLDDILVCNALDLSQFDENTFDIVLCMGALYHVNSDDLKEKAISESVRVCKPGGIVVLSYLSGTDKNGYIHQGIFFSSAPGEIEGMAIKHDLEKMHHISTRSSSHFEDNLNELSGESFQEYMEQRYLTCEDDGAAGDVALWIGRRNDK